MKGYVTFAIQEAARRKVCWAIRAVGIDEVLRYIGRYGHEAMGAYVVLPLRFTTLINAYEDSLNEATVSGVCQENSSLRGILYWQGRDLEACRDDLDALRTIALCGQSCIRNVSGFLFRVGTMYNETDQLQLIEDCQERRLCGLPRGL